MPFGLLAFGVLLMVFLLGWALAAERAEPGEFRRDQFSSERAARLAQIQLDCKPSRRADTGGMRRVA
jgi:hypothetical protein